MAVDMFMKLTDIPGESGDQKGHENEIDVLAWSWGMSQAGTLHSGTGGGAGKVNVQDISFTKWVDKASATLMLCICKGTHINEATLTVRKAGDTPLEYIIITMMDCLVTSQHTGGSGGEEQLTENIVLNFAKVKFKYKTQETTGGAGVENECNWDIKGNVPM